MLITSLSGGGAERVASELSMNFKNDIERKIITLTDNISYGYDQKPESLHLKLDLKKPFLWILYSIIGILRYRKKISSNEPDISLSFLLLDNIINILSNMFNKNVKIVISIHTNLQNKFKKNPFYKLIVLIIPLIMNRADRIIAVSEGVKNNLIDEFGIIPEKIIVLYNPIDTEKISRQMDSPVQCCEIEKPTYINIGRLTEVKGQWHLIRAFSLVRKQMDARLIICGEGPLESFLKKLVIDLNLDEDVLFTGWVENPFSYLAKSDVYVCSSISEALPYTILEAMACGLPIISTDCDYGPSEILQNGGCGILIPSFGCESISIDEPLSDTEIALANAMITLIHDADLFNELSNASLKRVEVFNIKITIKKYEDLFLTIS